MSGRSRKRLSPSLFPFLAVLVCTLGTLILLLALVAQNATETAEQNARAKTAANKQQVSEPTSGPPRPSQEDASELLAEATFRVEQLVAFRDSQTADLEERRDQLTHVEDHMQRLKDRLMQLQREAELAMGDQPIEEVDDETIGSLQAKIAEELADLEEIREEATNKKPRVVIVPHKGPNGTDRRPVYLECDAKGVRIWPEGSWISIAQLVNSTRGANPLDASLRAVRLHAMKHYGDTAPPYPLLVVRPSGTASFWAARAAMGDWDDHFGYELVPSDVELAFDKPDAQLRERIDIAIRETTARQQPRGLVRGSSRSSGHGSRVGSGRTRKLPTLSAAALDQKARSSGYQAHRDAYPQSQSQRSPYVSSSNSYGSSSPYSAGRSYSASQGNTGGYDMGTDRQTIADAVADRKLANEMESAAREMRTNQLGDENLVPGLTGDALSGTGMSKVGASGTGSFQIEDDRQIESLFEASEKIGSRAALGTESGIGSQGLGSSELAAGSGSDDGDIDQRQAKAGVSETGSEQPMGNAKNQSASASEIAQSFETDSSNAGSQSLSQSRSQSGGSAGENSSGAKSSSDASMMSQGTSSETDPADTETQVMVPSLTYDLSKNEPTPDSNNWALPSPDMEVQGNAIVRSVKMQCHENRFVLLRSSARNSSTTFQVSDQNVQQAVLDLGHAVRDRIALWGAALPGGRWEPQLEVEVFQGAEQRFAQLVELMSNSGVNIVLRQAK